MNLAIQPALSNYSFFPVKIHFNFPYVLKFGEIILQLKFSSSFLDKAVNVSVSFTIDDLEAFQDSFRECQKVSLVPLKVVQEKTF